MTATVQTSTTASMSNDEGYRALWVLWETALAALGPIAIGGGGLVGTLVWPTNDPWPTSLPGTASGGIPAAATLPADHDPAPIDAGMLTDPFVPTGLPFEPTQPEVNPL